MFESLTLAISLLALVKYETTIDMVITKFADCPIKRIPAKILNVIRIGAYELIYSAQTPEYAIVDEAVENAKTIAGKKPTSFVNAVLRQIERNIKNRQAQITKNDIQKTLPRIETVGCQFNIDILPDSDTDPAGYLSAAFSLPKWLIEQWISEFGFEQTLQICFASNRRPSVYLRVNQLKATSQQLIENFKEADIEAEIVEDFIIKIRNPQAVTELPGFTEGLFTVQDLTAYKIVKKINPQSDWTILDPCAAPGGKTTHLAEATNDKAKIIATDINNKRLGKLKENIQRLNLNSINVIDYENIKTITAEFGSLDCILLDVPCSNTGVLAKRPEARYRIKPNALKELTKIQAELLQSAGSMIKPKGKVCYSTCSIQSCENSDIIKNFLNKNTDFKLELEHTILPSAKEPDHDGGYLAIIVKN